MSQFYAVALIIEHTALCIAGKNELPVYNICCADLLSYLYCARVLCYMYLF